MALCSLVTLAGVLFTASARSAAGPLYDVKAGWGDTYLQPGGAGQFFLYIGNIGDAKGAAPMTIDDQLPTGVRITSIKWEDGVDDLSSLCSGVGTSNLSCRVPAATVEELAPPPGGQSGLLHGEDGFSPKPSGFMPVIYVNVAIDEGASGTGINTASVSGGGATEPATDVDPVTFSTVPSEFGVVPDSFKADLFDREFPFGGPARQAGDHPFELRVNFDLNESTLIDASDHLRYTTPHGRLADAAVTLPPGVVGNPEATPKCDSLDFFEAGAVLTSTHCPPETQVGYLNIWFAEESQDDSSVIELDPADLTRVPIYSLAPPVGAIADFAFNVGGFGQGHIFPKPDPARNYAIETLVPNISTELAVRGVEVTIWGVPGDPAHDRFRYFNGPLGTEPVVGAPFDSVAVRPLLTNSMDCDAAVGGTGIRVASYGHRGEFTPEEEYGDPYFVSGCEDSRVRFEPDVSLRPSSHEAGGVTGLDLKLELPQRDDEVTDAQELYAENGFVQGIATPPLRKAVVTLPEGLVISTSGAQGLRSCAPAQISLGTGDPGTCPASSTLGTVKIVTPVLSEALEGRLYLAKQDENSFGSLVAGYLVAEGEGVRIKLPVRFDLDPISGRITVTIDDLPQQPFSSLMLHLKGGPRGVLRMPEACGTYAARYELTSWADRQPVIGTSELKVDEDCRPAGFEPELAAGTTNAVAGSAAPFVLDLTRRDGEESLSSLSLSLPPGLAANFAAVQLCPDVQAATGACPPSSRVGSAQISAGAGPIPLWIPQPGATAASVYLSGPYKGAPFSFVVSVPALAGPFDLGTVVTRAAIRLDSKTAQVTIRLEPLPRILRGVPIEYRAIRLRVDRPNFALNPTSCEEMALEGVVTSSEGTVADVSDRFQVGDCASLAFKPRLSLRFSGATERNGYPKTRAVIQPSGGDANLRTATIVLPRGEYLDQTHIRGVCRRADFAARSCPVDSAYGRVGAWSPLLDRPLKGHLYLREGAGRFPDLAVDLKGQVDLVLVGHLDSSHARVRVSFARLPDIPISRLELALRGGRQGLIVNSESLCAKRMHATASFVGHNGKSHRTRPDIRPGCGKQDS